MSSATRRTAHRPARLGCVLAAAALLAACQEVRLPGVYRIDIQQGNVITQEQLAALEKGMDKSKVRFILGTPLVADAFNQDRWDYYYSFDRRGEEPVRRVISVYFENDRLARVGGDVRPAAGPIVVEARKDELVTVPRGYRDDGLLAALTPDFLSDRVPRRRKPSSEPGQSEAGAPADQQGSAAASASQPPPGIQITAEDERYLRELMQGFGDASAPAEQPSSAAAAAAGQPQEQAQEEEGVLSRWARRLGLKSEEGSAAAPAPRTPTQ